MLKHNHALLRVPVVAVVALVAAAAAAAAASANAHWSLSGTLAFIKTSEHKLFIQLNTTIQPSHSHRLNQCWLAL